MTRTQKQILNDLSKEQLIYLIEQLERSQILICEVCVEESKCHINSNIAVSKIRDYIYDMPSMYNSDELKAFIDMKMNKISPKEYRRIIGLDD